QRQSTSIFGQRTALLLGDLTGGLVKDQSWRGRGIEEHDIRTILWSRCAVDTSHCHHLVVGFRIGVARERRGRTQEKRAGTRYTERGNVLPLKGGSDSGSIHNGTTRCSLPLSRNWQAGRLE